MYQLRIIKYMMSTAYKVSIRHRIRVELRSDFVFDCSLGHLAVDRHHKVHDVDCLGPLPEIPDHGLYMYQE